MSEDTETLCIKNSSLQEAIQMYSDKFTKQEELKTLRYNLNDTTRSRRRSTKESADNSIANLEAEILQIVQNLQALWSKGSIEHLSKLRKRYRLDVQDMEILMFLLYQQAKGGETFPGFGCGTKGSTILASLDAGMPSVMLIYKLMPGSPLVENGLIETSRMNTESVLRTDWTLPDRVVVELTQAPSQIEEPDSDSDDSPAGMAIGSSIRASSCALADVITPRFKLGQVIMPETNRRKIDALLAQHRNAGRLLDEWGLGESVPYGRGATLLLYGPPGTGKTMLGEAIAGETGADLMVASYPGIENMYFGETEKSIARLFGKAKHYQCVLLIDECDAILGRRRSGGQFQDKCANQQFLVMSQEIERFEGILILTTNRPTDLDEALDRRIALKLEMPLPGEQERYKIWQTFLTRVPTSEDVNIETLADRYVFSGGYIKNAVFAAARTAISRAETDGTQATVGMADLSQAASDEAAGFRNISRTEPIGFRKI